MPRRQLIQGDAAGEGGPNLSAIGALVGMAPEKAASFEACQRACHYCGGDLLSLSQPDRHRIPVRTTPGLRGGGHKFPFPRRCTPSLVLETQRQVKTGTVSQDRCPPYTYVYSRRASQWRRARGPS